MVCLFTPAGQSVSRCSGNFMRISRGHIRSVHAEAAVDFAIKAHCSAYGASIATGGAAGSCFHFHSRYSGYGALSAT